MQDGRPIPAFVNAASGRGPSALAPLRGDPTFAVERVEDPLRLPDLVRAAIAAGATRVVVAGGDGTVACAARELVNTDTELAVMPAGTLDHFAREHHVPLDLGAAAALARDGEASGVDVAFAGERLFVNTSSVGAYVQFVRRREKLERAGLPYLLASLIACFAVLLRVRRRAITIELDGERRVYRTPLVFVGVGERELAAPALGGRAPNGRRGLHVLVVHGRTRSSLVLLGIALAAKGLRARPLVRVGSGVDSFVVSRAVIETKRERERISIDGELHLVATPIEYRYAPDALRLVSPRATAAAASRGPSSASP